MNKKGLPRAIYPDWFRAKSRGFTIVEMLIVIAIIGILSGIVLVATMSSKARARDVRRRADVATIKTALELYRDLKGSYSIVNKNATSPNDLTGYYGNSTTNYSLGWFNYECTTAANYTRSIANGLVSWGFFNAAPVDPRRACLTSCGGCAATSGSYMYRTDSTGSIYCIYAQLERITDSDSNGWDDNGTNSPTGGYSTGYSMNYAVGNCKF